MRFGDAVCIEYLDGVVAISTKANRKRIGCRKERGCCVIPSRGYVVFFSLKAISLLGPTMFNLLSVSIKEIRARRTSEKG